MFFLVKRTTPWIQTTSQTEQGSVARDLAKITFVEFHPTPRWLIESRDPRRMLRQARTTNSTLLHKQPSCLPTVQANVTQTYHKKYSYMNVSSPRDRLSTFTISTSVEPWKHTYLIPTHTPRAYLPAVESQSVDITEISSEKNQPKSTLVLCLAERRTIRKCFMQSGQNPQQWTITFNFTLRANPHSFEKKQRPRPLLNQKVHTTKSILQFKIKKISRAVT